MARRTSAARSLATTIAAWVVGFVIFFPILWMVITSFKTELEAFSTPPSLLFFHWTTENYAAVQERSDYLKHVVNSIVIAGGSTVIAMLIAIPAAWSMAFAPSARSRDVLLWILSTKMMPSVGVLVPIYLIYRDTALLDTRVGLVLILCLGNLPIVVWMLFTYFKEIPKDILEAAPLTVFIASYSSPEGLFWAKLSAASTLAIVPILILGWFSQRQLVRGLTFGAVK